MAAMGVFLIFFWGGGKKTVCWFKGIYRPLIIRCDNIPLFQKFLVAYTV